jgi:hypothetical protein
MGRSGAHAARRRHTWGFAWTSLCLAFAVQLVEIAADRRFEVPASGHAAESQAWLAAAGSTGRTWLAPLAGTVAALLALSPLALRGERRLRPVAWAFAAVILADAAAHLIGSLVLWRRLPGVLSVPWLAATAMWLIDALRRSAAQE